MFSRTAILGFVMTVFTLASSAQAQWGYTVSESPLPGYNGSPTLYTTSETQLPGVNSAAIQFTCHLGSYEINVNGNEANVYLLSSEGQLNQDWHLQFVANDMNGSIYKVVHNDTSHGVVFYQDSQLIVRQEYGRQSIHFMSPGYVTRIGAPNSLIPCN